MRRHIDGIGLSTENMICHNEKLWFTEIDNNELYYYDLKERKTVLYYTFKNESNNRLFCSSVIYENWLVCIPFNASGIYMIEMSTEEVRYIPIKTKELDIEKSGAVLAKFMDAVLFDDSIYMVGTFYPVIVEFNISLNKLNYYGGWYRSVSPYFNSTENALVRKIVAINDKLYAPLCKGNAVLEFGMKNHQYKVYQVGDKSCNYSAACYDGEDIWLAPRNTGGVVRWNADSNECQIYNKYPKELLKTSNSFNDIYCDENQNIVLVPGASNMFLHYNKQTDEIGEYDECLRGFGNVSICQNQEEKYMFSFEENILAAKLDVGYEYFNLNCTQHMERVFSIPENRKDTLVKYILDYDEEEKERVGSAIGKVIWKKMR